MKQCDAVVKDTLILPWFENILLKRLKIQFLLIMLKFPCDVPAIKTFVLHSCQCWTEEKKFSFEKPIKSSA